MAVLRWTISIVRPMQLFLILFVSVFAVSFLSTPFLGGGWVWDAANGFGLAGFVGLLYLSITTTGARDLKRHEYFSYAVVVVITVHALWFLLLDGSLLEYLKPAAPMYMWAGIGGLILLFGLTLVSVLPTRYNVFRRYRSFKLWHRFIAIGAVILTGYHVLAVQFYFSNLLQSSVLVLVCAWVCFSRELRSAPHQITVASTTQFLVATVLGSTAFVLVRNIA